MKKDLTLFEILQLNSALQKLSTLSKTVKVSYRLGKVAQNIEPALKLIEDQRATIQNKLKDGGNVDKLNEEFVSFLSDTVEEINFHDLKFDQLLECEGHAEGLENAFVFLEQILNNDE